MTPQTLIMGQSNGPCVLVLVPDEDLGKEDNRRIVPIWLGMAEATHLSFAIEGNRLQRPMTHELFVSSLHELGAVVDRVEINDVKGHTFYSDLVLRAGDRIITLDSRPSDSITLAILHNAPIYMADEVLSKAGYPFLFRQEADEQELDHFRDFVESLTPEDFSSEEQG